MAAAGIGNAEATLLGRTGRTWQAAPGAPDFPERWGCEWGWVGLSGGWAGVRCGGAGSSRRPLESLYRTVVVHRIGCEEGPGRAGPGWSWSWSWSWTVNEPKVAVSGAAHH